MLTFALYQRRFIVNQLRSRFSSVSSELLFPSNLLLASGAHIEGPFINKEKKGAHNEKYIKSNATLGLDALEETYGSLENVVIITIAPEIPGILDCIKQLKDRNIVVSIGINANVFVNVYKLMDI